MWTVEQVQSLDLVLEPEPGEQQWPTSIYGSVKSLIACDGLYGQSLQTPSTLQPMRCGFISLILNLYALLVIDKSIVWFPFSHPMSPAFVSLFRTAPKKIKLKNVYPKYAYAVVENVLVSTFK